MIGTLVGIAARDLSSTAGRVALGLARRLLPKGYEPRLVANRLVAGAAEASDGRVIDVERVGDWPLGSWWRAYSFDRAARAWLKRRGAMLVHGFGDLIVQDVLTLAALERSRQRHWPGAPAPSQGAGYLRRMQLGPGGARAIVTLSEMARRDLIADYDVPAGSVRVVPPGVDANFFPLDQRGPSRFTLFRAAGWTDHHKVVLAAVTDDPAGQDFALLARAVDRLADRRPAALCVLGGADLSKNAAVRDLARRGRFFQVAHSHRSENYFLAADVFALPAHYEEFGLPVLDALAAGTPVVVSARTGAREVFSSGIEGMVVEGEPTVEAWAAALEAGWSLDRAACRRAGESRSWDAALAATVKIYQELL